MSDDQQVPISLPRYNDERHQLDDNEHQPQPVAAVSNYNGFLENTIVDLANILHRGDHTLRRRTVEGDLQQVDRGHPLIPITDDFMDYMWRKKTHAQKIHEALALRRLQGSPDLQHQLAAAIEDIEEIRRRIFAIYCEIHGQGRIEPGVKRELDSIQERMDAVVRQFQIQRQIIIGN